MTPPDLIIFDCDGVLIDSEDLSADVLIAELSRLGIHIDRAHVRTHFIGRSFPTVANLIRDSFATSLPDDFEARYRATLLTRFETDLQPTPGIADLLGTLPLPKCVATSSSPPRVARSLAITGLNVHFGPHVFTASQVARGKPFPDLFLFAARHMGHDPDRCTVIEDSRPGIDAGLAAGMRVLAYTGGAHLRDRPFVAPDGVLCFDNWAELPHLLGFGPPRPD